MVVGSIPTRPTVLARAGHKCEVRGTKAKGRGARRRWTWITGFVIFYVIMSVLTFALCSAAKMGRSDLPDVEPEPDAESLATNPSATTDGPVPETVGSTAAPSEVARADG